MIRLRGTVQYVDGRTETFETGTAALAAWERYALKNGYPIGEQAPPILSSLVVAHHALAIAADLEPWIESVEGVELEADGVPPTPPAASSG